MWYYWYILNVSVIFLTLETDVWGCIPGSLAHVREALLPVHCTGLTTRYTVYHEDWLIIQCDLIPVCMTVLNSYPVWSQRFSLHWLMIVTENRYVVRWCGRIPSHWNVSGPTASCLGWKAASSPDAKPLETKKLAGLIWTSGAAAV